VRGAGNLYLHNALGQRVFKSEPQATQYAPDEEELGSDFINWLKKNFGWLFAKAQANATLGQSFVYADAPLPEWALLGEYGNGGSKSAGRLEILWLPTEDGNAIPVGLYRNGRFYAVHPDHLGTPRLITDDGNKPVWQWPYSAFGANKPTGILKATTKPKQAFTNEPVLLKATSPALTFNLRYPGQYWDEESNLSYNYQRSYQAAQGRYSQPDPIGLEGGLNRFGYALGNPQNYHDPDGRLAIADDLVLLGGAAVIAGCYATPSCRNVMESVMQTAAKTIVEACTPEERDPCKGLRRQIEEHQRKRREYLANPLGADNKGFLAAAAASGNTERYAAIQAARVASLQGQIANFQRLLEECLRKHGK
jgi:RHS repeat-associated protein